LQTSAALESRNQDKIVPRLARNQRCRRGRKENVCLAITLANCERILARVWEHDF
jgi:hypothetical protein